MTRLTLCCCALPALMALSTAAEGADVSGSRDHPLIKRYEGSTILRYSSNAFEEYRLPLGPVEGRGRQAKSIRLEGHVTRITYLVPAGRSTLEVIRNYEAELSKTSFTPLFSGAHEALGEGKFDNAFTAAGYHGIALPSFSGTNFD